MGLFQPKIIRQYNETGIVSATMRGGEKEPKKRIKRLAQWVSESLIERSPLEEYNAPDNSAPTEADNEEQREEAFWRSRKMWAEREWQSLSIDTEDPTAPIDGRVRDMLAKRVAMAGWIEKITKSGGA